MKISYAPPVKPMPEIIEQKPKRRRWDRWVYLAILLLLLGSLLKWLLWPWVFTTADGILYQDQFDVQFTEDIRILDFNVTDHQRVRVGDTLFTYQDRSAPVINPILDSLDLKRQAQSLDGELIAVQAQMEKRRLFLLDLRKRLAFWESERERKEKLVYLGAITPNELANVDRSIDDVSHQIATTRVEYRVLQQEVAALRQLNTRSTTIGLAQQQAVSTAQAYLAPVGGIVDRLRVPKGGVCYRQESVTSIVDTNYVVRAYVDMANLDHFKQDDRVIVLLPYGNTTLAGRVNRIYTVSEDKDKVLFNSVGTNKHGVVVEIVPSGTKNWEGLVASNIPVKIRKGRIAL